MAMGQQIGDREHFFGIRTINDCVSSQSLARGKTALITHRAMCVLAPASFCLSFSNNCRLLWFYAIKDNGREKLKIWRLYGEIIPSEMGV